jgi:hypothetical protein
MLKGISARLSFTVIGITALSVASAASAASLEMGSYLNAPGGVEIEAGDYDAAIASALSPAWRHDVEGALIAATNLCVAYTIKRELEGAFAACEEALTHARRVDKATGARLRASATARALTNRGVLRAVTGNSIGAASDFREAARSSGKWGAPTRNLAYLESSPTHRLAMARASN